MPALRILLRVCATVATLLLLGWAALALWIDAGSSDSFTGPLVSALFLLVNLVWMIFAGRLVRVNAGVVGLCCCVLVWWLNLAPSNSRDWQHDVARLPRAVVDGTSLTIQNMRSFRYLADGSTEEQWVTQTYDLDQLTGMDIFFSFWGPRAYGHTIASWQFADGRHLAISIETRKEQGESYSPIRGFFRQFELYYVVSDELDVIGVRGGRRSEEVELYRIYTPDDGDRRMLLDYVAQLNDLRQEPRWYNALTNNCTTTMWRHARSIGSSFPLDWRLLANGYVLQLAHALGTVNNDLAVDALREQSVVTQKVQEQLAVQADSRAFSAALRASLPRRPDGGGGRG